MNCSNCGSDKATISEEKEPIKPWQIVLSILLFPIGLLFIFCRGKINVIYCPECGHTEDFEKEIRDSEKKAKRRQTKKNILAFVDGYLTWTLISRLFNKKK